MAEVLQLSDGSIHTVFDIKDMMELIDTHLGYEARRWLEEYLTEDIMYRTLRKRSKVSGHTTGKS